MKKIMSKDKKALKHQVKDLLSQIVNLNAENEKLKNEYLKAYADAENYKKRVGKDLENGLKYRIQSFAMEILPAIDNLERALATCNDEQLKNGISMVYQQIINSLAKEGVSEILAADQKFDPNLHQALMTEHVDGIEPDMVIEVLQKGYQLKDRILRAALVKVSE